MIDTMERSIPTILTMPLLRMSRCSKLDFGCFTLVALVVD